jgi:diacylglycerol kinase (ATP)
MRDTSIGLISNPASGHNREQFPKISARIANCRPIHHLVTRHREQIRPALAEMAAREVRVLAINGGDGTCAAVVGELLESALFETPPLIALLPGGTANMNAGDIGLRGSLERATARFCRWCEGGRTTRGRIVQRALLRVVNGAGEPAHYGMFLGAGAVIHGTDYAHREIHSRGLRDDLSLALGTLRTFWGLIRHDPAFNRHVRVSVALDGGEPQRHDALILAVSTLQRLAFGMRPFWGEGPGEIRLTLIEQNSEEFGRTFVSILRGRPGSNAVPSAGYVSRNAVHLTLELDGKFNLDGEVMEPAGPLEIGLSKRLGFLRL